MVTRSKLELPVNQPVNIELIYDEPVIGENQYGQYFMYAVKNNGSEFAFFPTREVHNELKNLKRGDSAVITKLAAQRGTKLITKYVVESKSAKQGEQIAVQEDNTIADETKILNKRTDKFFEIMLSSYRDGLQIQEELNGMVDVTRIAITLFIARSKNGN